MNVQSLCLVSSMPRYPQALQELPMVCFLGLTCWRNDKTQNVKERTVQHFETLLQILRNSYQISFRVVTLRTQHKFSDEPIKHVLQLVRLVGSVDDVTVIFGIKLGLSAEFTTKKLGRVCEERRTKYVGLVLHISF